MILFIKSFYYLELLMAELVLLQAYPRRKHFLPRLFASLFVSGILFLLITIKMDALAMTATHPLGNMLFHFLRLFLIILLSVFSLYYCFDSPFGSVFCTCIGGVAIQQIGYQISVLFCLGRPGMFLYYESVVELFVSLVLDLILLLTLGRSMRRNQYHRNYDKSLVSVSLITLFICIGIIRLSRFGSRPDIYKQICLALYSITCCSLTLYIQFFLYRYIRLKSEHVILCRMNEEEKKQYELSRMNSHLLNIKCHDLKHQLPHMKNGLPESETAEIEKLIRDYESFAKTGLEPLDIALNEKA